jgi:hypothetical protein
MAKTWVGKSRQLTPRPGVQCFGASWSQFYLFNTLNDGVVGGGFLQWVRKHVDKLSRVEAGRCAVGLKSMEKLLALVYV